MIRPLKKALLLIPAYIGMLLSSCIIGEFLYMLYFNTTRLIAGKQLQLFNKYALENGFFVIAPIVFLLSGIFLSCYRIRHSRGGCLPVIMYGLLGAVTWCLLYPAFIELKGKWTPRLLPEDSVLTSGYFRREGNDVFYLMHTPDGSNADSIVINESANPENAVFPGYADTQKMVETASPFKDILIRETIPAVPGWISAALENFEARAESAWHEGLISWLSFVAFGLALFSVYAISFCSEWRLINTLYVFVMDAGVMSFNLLYFSSYFAEFRNLESLLCSSIKFLTHLHEPLLVCMNVLFSLVFTVIGIIEVRIHAAKNKRSSI
jgi:hypothetical protein